MEVEIIQKEGCELTLKITLSQEEVLREFDKKYNRLIQSSKIPGFRKGKIPRQILEARYGQSVQQEVMQDLIVNSYQAAIKEKNILSLSSPTIEEVTQEPFSFVAKVEVTPDIEVNNYIGIPLQKKVTKITDKEVEEGIRRLQEKHAQVEVVEKPVGKNSIIIFDFEAFKDDKPLSGQKNFLLEIGKNVFPAEFERQLFGLKKGQEKRFKIKLSKDFTDPNMAGQKITFKVKINEVKKRKIVPLDDEFAKDIGDFNTIKELREAYKKDLTNAAEFEARQKLKDEIITILSAQYSFPVPETLVKREIDYMLVNFVKNLQLYQLTLDDYLKQKNITIDACKEKYRPAAIERLKKFFILDAIAQKENIRVGDEEYENWVKNNFRTQPSEIKRYMEDDNQKANLKEELRIQKTLDFLVDSADIK